MACLCSLSSHPSGDCLGLFTWPCQRCDIQVLFKLLLVLHLLTFHWPKQIMLAQSGIKWEGPTYTCAQPCQSLEPMNYISPCLNPCEGPLPGGAAVKNLLPMQETQVQSLGGEDSLEGIAPFLRVVQLTPVFLPGESHGRGRFTGYSPQGCKESNTTEVTGHAWYGLPGVPFSTLLHEKYWVPIVLISCCCYNKLLQT